ncbi:hypothetical protein M0804_002109 [Polistes exclamans]|nr:hypothetical protein M0804_002109 [Polistes exclamans]
MNPLVRLTVLHLLSSNILDLWWIIEIRIGQSGVQQCSVCLWCGFQQAYSQYIPATRAQVSGAQGGQTGVAMDGTYLVEASF